jgi:hypothetical protein
MSEIAPKQNAFKFKIAPHKQKSIVRKQNWQEDEASLAKEDLCLSTPNHNGKSGTQAVMTLAQWHRNQIIRDLWLLAKKRLKMDSCLRGAI